MITSKEFDVPGPRVLKGSEHPGRRLAGLSGSIASVLIASACGGGFDTTPVAQTPAALGPTAQGLWVGTTSTNRTVTGLVLSDGTSYVLYSAVGNASIIAGVVQGTGTSSGGTFSSSNAVDFNLESPSVQAATVSANYSSKQSFNGTITYAIGSVTFTSAYNTDYETVPSFAVLAGTFSGQVATSLGVQAATVTISPSGVVSGGAGGCSISGTTSPRTDGNAYNFSITFGAAPCAFPNQTFAGIAYFNSVTKRLYAAAPNAARNDGVLFVGTKP